MARDNEKVKAQKDLANLPERPLSAEAAEEVRGGTAIGSVQATLASNASEGASTGSRK